MGRRIEIPEFVLEPEDLDELETEASIMGVPLEYYVVEGMRVALWKGLKRRDAIKAERAAQEYIQRHREIDERIDALVQRSKDRKARNEQAKEELRTGKRGPWGNVRRSAPGGGP
jgi:hypothetical protein